MSRAFETSILVKKEGIAGQFRPAFSDSEFFADVLIGRNGTYTPTPSVATYFVDQSGNNFVDELGNIFISS